MVIDDDNGGIRPVATERPNPAGAVENNARPETVGVMPWNFGGSNVQPFGAPIGLSLGSELIVSIKDEMTEIYKGASQDFKISIIPFDRDSMPGFYFSCLAIAVQRTDLNKVAFYTLILEGTNQPLMPVTKSLPNQATVEITRLSSDAADKTLFEQMKARLATIYKNCNIISVDSMVIPRDINAKDRSVIHALAFNAALACGNELAMSAENFKDINVAEMVQLGLNNNSRRALSIYANYGRQPKTDIVNEPIRSDVRCIFKETPLNRANDLAVNTTDQATTLAEINGYMDVVWVGGNDVNPYMPAQQIKLDNYAARFVITDIDNLKAYTYASLLLAISSVSALSQDNNWMLAFRPQSMNRKAIDVTDIGALGYEINLTNDPNTAYKRIDTKSDSFTPPMLGTLIGTLFKPGIMVSIDVPDSGAQTWYTSIFSAAEGSPKAINKLLLAANNLTNGNFARLFDNSPIFVDNNNRIHMGYYINKENEKRDIREIDYLAVANLVGETDRMRITNWSDTFTRTNIPLEIRLAERKKMILELTSNNAVFTGYAERITFSSKFLNALIEGIKMCGLSVNLVTPLSASDFNAMRGRSMFAGDAMMSNNGYATTSVPNMGNNNYYRHFNDRFI